MSFIKKAPSFFIFILFKNKFKWFVFWICTSLFLIFLFPFGDLGDLVTAKVSEATKNQVLFKFDDMKFGLPLSLNFTDVQFQNKGSAPITTESFKITPSITSLLKLKPGFTAKASNIWDGNLDLSFGSGGKSDSGVKLQNLDVELKKISLAKLSGNIPSKTPINLQGILSGTLTAALDQSFEEQPNSEFDFSSPKFELLPLSVNQGGMSIELPRLSWSVLKLKGRLVGSELIIEDGILGNNKDNLSLKIKGKMGLKFTKRGNNVAPLFTSYDLRMDIQTVGDVDPTLNLAFIPIDQFKRSTPSGNRYLLRAQSRNMRTPPRFTAISTL